MGGAIRNPKKNPGIDFLVPVVASENMHKWPGGGGGGGGGGCNWKSQKNVGRLYRLL